jgi:hypothetical protein
MVVVTAKHPVSLQLKEFVINVFTVLTVLTYLLLDLLSSEIKEVNALKEVSVLLDTNSLDLASLVDIWDPMRQEPSFLLGKNLSVLIVLKDNTVMDLLTSLVQISLTLM